MARTSRRKEKREMQNGISEEKSFLAGIYARLSVDSTEEKRESIDSQIAIAKEHISGLQDMTLVEIYSDLGATGTNFARRDFQRLMEDIRQKKVNCVVVKDFSRFGRNYIEVGNYLERIFPFMGVRFISVTDHYDSLRTADSNESLSIHLKNIVNELYARDIGIRVKSAKLTRLKQGSYVGGIPAYGYTKQKMGQKNVLLPEEGTKEVVLQIYEWYDAGTGIREIRKRLYERKVHRPTEYRSTGHICCQEGDILRAWSETTLAAMLSNPVYTGVLIQKQGKTDPPVLVENTHEALVPRELFYRVAARRRSMQEYDQ